MVYYPSTGSLAMKFFRFLAVLFSVIILHLPCAGQSAGPYPSPTEHIANWMDEIIGPDNTGIVNGPLYVPPPKGYHSDHYLLSEPSPARVNFEGYRFDGLYALYDIYQDVLVLQHKSPKYTYQYLELDKVKANAFGLQERWFRQLENDFTKRRNISGYFEILFESPRICLVEKHQKFQRLKDRLVRYEIIQQKYILIDNQMNDIKRGKDLYKIFNKDDSEKIRDFAKAERIRMRSKKNTELIRLLAFCERLLANE